MAQAQREFSGWLDTMSFTRRVPMVFDITLRRKPTRERFATSSPGISWVRSAGGRRWIRCAAPTPGVVRDRAGPGVIRAGTGQWFGEGVEVFNVNNLRGIEMAARLDYIPPCQQKSFQLPSAC